MASIPSFLSKLASSYGDKPALVTDTEAVSFADFAEHVERVAAGLIASGIRAGDRVAIWLPNVPEWLEIACACGRIGAIAISCNTRFRSTEVGDIISRSRAKALVLWPGFKQIPFLDILAEVPCDLLGRLETLIIVNGDAESARKVSPPGRATITYESLSSSVPVSIPMPDADAGFVTFITSGTTSLPKFALHSQAAIIQHAEDIADAFGYRQPGVIVMTMNPLCGVLGFNQAFAALAAGVPQVLPVFFEAQAVATDMRLRAITHAAAIDEALERLLDAIPDQIAFPALHSVGSGSYNSDFETFVRKAELRGMRAFGIYGMSEVMALYARQPVELEAALRARAGGIPVSPRARVRARHVETGELLPHGEPGELELSGPSLMLRYDGDEAATEKAITTDGFIRTGDIGCTTPEGGFTFLSRMGDALRLSGFLVSPAEIAHVLESHPSVDRCQIIGHKVGATMRPVAFVIPRRGAAFAEADVISFCKQRLAPFKAPVRILPVDAFPTSLGPNGEKIQRGKLRDMAAAALPNAPA